MRREDTEMRRVLGSVYLCETLCESLCNYELHSYQAARIVSCLAFLVNELGVQGLRLAGVFL
jgi:hypothetical protein